MTAEPLTDEVVGTFTLGDGPTVRRLGFGAMRITGKGVWGEPDDPDEARRVLRRRRAGRQPDRHRRLIRS